MIFVPLLALLVLAALTALFFWKLAQHRRERLLFKHSDLGDTDLMLKASLVGDSTLEVGGLQGGPRLSPKEGDVLCGVATELTRCLGSAGPAERRLHHGQRLGAALPRPANGGSADHPRGVRG